MELGGGVSHEFVRVGASGNSRSARTRRAELKAGTGLLKWSAELFRFCETRTMAGCLALDRPSSLYVSTAPRPTRSSWSGYGRDMQWDMQWDMVRDMRDRALAGLADAERQRSAGWSRQ